MKLRQRLAIVVLAVMSSLTFSIAHADEVSDQVSAFQTAKANFDSSMNSYMAMKNQRMAEYRDVMAARSEAMKAMQSARKTILETFKANLDQANSDFMSARKGAKTAADKQAANNAKKKAIATAISARDDALALLVDLGPEPTKPSKK